MKTQAIPRWPRKIPILLIRIYQCTLKTMIPPGCRHIPSCSEYAIEAFRVHGLLRGGWLSLKRVLRCHPFGSRGYDPVPGKDGAEKPQSCHCQSPASS